jgi:SAM-dependent methyltransferase
VPLYHFNALAISRLLPRGGRLLDLGSGSGRLLAYLATGRPDVEVLGLELSKSMVESGNRMFADSALFPRVRLDIADMTRFVHPGLDRVDAVSINLALEHLPDLDSVRSLLGQIRALVARFDCGFWLFNHSRPKTLAAANLFPSVFTPDAPPSFREDSRNSLVASWRYEELMPLFRAVLGGGVQGRLSRWLPLYLAFWLESAGRPVTEGLWRGVGRPRGAAGRQFASFRMLLFPDVPLGT